MKRLLACLVVVGLLFGAAAHAAPVTLGEYRGNPIVKVLVDGAPLVSDVPAFAMDGRTLIPLSAVAGALGASVSWDQENLTVRISKPAPPTPPTSPTPPAATGPKVIGPEVFSKPVNLALVWTAILAPEEYAVLSEHVEKIVYGLVGEAIFNASIIVIPRSTFRTFDKYKEVQTELSKAATLAWVVIYYGELTKAFHEGRDVGDAAVQKEAHLKAAAVAVKIAKVGTTEADKVTATMFEQELASSHLIPVIPPTDPDQTFKASGP